MLDRVYGNGSIAPRLKTDELFRIWNSAWELADDIALHAFAEQAQTLPAQGQPKLELHLGMLYPYGTSSADRTRLGDVLDFQDLGMLQHPLLDDVAVGVTAPVRLKAEERFVTLTGAVRHFALAYGYLDADSWQPDSQINAY